MKSQFYNRAVELSGEIVFLIIRLSFPHTLFFFPSLSSIMIESHQKRKKNIKITFFVQIVATQTSLFFAPLTIEV